MQCCGFAGERGFVRPELNEHALRHLKESIPADCTSGVSSSRTCEIGLSEAAGVPYRSILYLVEGCSTAKPVAAGVASRAGADAVRMASATSSAMSRD